MIHLYALCCHYSAILHHTLLFLFVLIVFVLWQLITSFLVYDCSLLYLPFTVLLFYLYISAPHSSRSPLAILLPWCCLLWQSKGFLYFSTLKLSPQCFAATLLNILTECQESLTTVIVRATATWRSVRSVKRVQRLWNILAGDLKVLVRQL